MTQDFYKLSKHSHMKEIRSDSVCLTYNVFLLECDERKKTSLVLTFDELQSLMGLCVYYNNTTIESKHLLVTIINVVLKKAGMKINTDKMNDNRYGKIHVILPDGKEGLIVF